MKNKIFYLPKFQNSGTLPKSTERLAIRDNTRVAWNPNNNFISKQSKHQVNPKLLQNIGETILDFTPVIGDIKGLTVDPYRAYKENRWKDGLTMMGLGLLGLIPFVGDTTKKISKLQLPVFKDDIATAFYNTKFVKQNTDIKNEKSLMAERARNGGVERIGLKVDANKLADDIQNYEPDVRTTYDINGNRKNFQQAEYQWGHDPNEYYFTKEPEHLYIVDDSTTLGEMNSGIDANKKLSQKLTSSQIRQILDHELGHLVDKKYRPEFINSSTKLFMDQDHYLSNASEVAQRVGQIKSALGITDGSKTFTGKELKEMFETYLNSNNVDNAISDTKKRIQNNRWNYFADWVNKNVLSFSPLIILPSTILDNNDNDNDNKQ